MYIQHFKWNSINNMDHMRISGVETSSVILAQQSSLKSRKVMLKKTYDDNDWNV